STPWSIGASTATTSGSPSTTCAPARAPTRRCCSASRQPEVAAGLTIRRGTRRDVPTILALIRGLADYERLSHECVVTAAGLRRHGFGRRPYFQTLICRRRGR